MGMRSLAKKFTPERLEAAATRAMRLGIHLYSSVRLMLEHEIDRQPLKEEVAERPAMAAVFRQLLEYLRSQKGVWFAHHRDVAKWIAEQKFEDTTYPTRFAPVRT